MDGMESGYGQRVWILGMGEIFFFAWMERRWVWMEEMGAGNDEFELR